MIFDRLANWAGVLLGASWMIAVLLPHLNFICQPCAQELNEPAAWYGTYLLDHGRNPYALSELPAAAQYFGPFYNYIVLAFKPLLGTSYAAHRTVNLIFIAASLWLIGAGMRRAGASPGMTTLSLALYYWLCVNNIMISARPDAPGLFFFLLGVILPWRFEYSRGPVLAGLFFAFLGFHCKAYFVLAALVPLMGTALQRSKRDAIIYAAGFSVAIVLSVAVLGHYFQCYFLETIPMQYVAVVANSADEFTARHTREFFLTGWPYLIPMVIVASGWFGRFPFKAAARKCLSGLFRPDTPLLEERMPVLGIVFLIYAALVYFKMGSNGGATFTYHIHLLFPLMFLLSASVVNTALKRIGFTFVLGLLILQQWNIPEVVDSSPAYARLSQLVTEHKNVFALPIAAQVLAENGRTVYDDGFTTSIPFLFNGKLMKKYLLDAEIEQSYDRMVQKIRTMVDAQSYDMMITRNNFCEYCDMAEIRRNYELKETFMMPTYFGHADIQVWYPKGASARPAPAAAGAAP